MQGRLRSTGLGFSIVEIVIGMAIMATLLGVTINTYTDSVTRAREQVALSDAQAIANSIQRWQLDNNRPFPFDSLLPLVPQYIRNVKNDPWSGTFQVNSVKKIVYSFGPNGQDDGGSGDDVKYSFDTSADVPPGPPEGVTVRLVSSPPNSVRVQWKVPSRNADGSVPVTDMTLERYHISIRSAQEITTRPWMDLDTVQDGGDGTRYYDKARTDIQSIYSTDPDALDKSYYFTVRARDDKGNLSPPSNQAGLFVAKTVEPRIIVFQPSSQTPGVSSAFSFFIEVADPDANLNQVRLMGWGQPVAAVTWTTGGAAPFRIDNPFRFVVNWAPPPVDLSLVANRTVYLEARDGTGVTTTSSSVVIDIRNSAPAITAVNPGITLLTVNPANPVKVRIPFTCEAIDQEGNMNRMEVRLMEKTTPTETEKQVFGFDLNPPGGVMVRQVDFDPNFYFSLLTKRDYEIEVKARDTLGDWSTPRRAKLLIKEDTTPPDALALSIDPSNFLLATAPAGPWYIRTPGQIAFECDAFEVESPPIRFQVRVAEAPLLGLGGTPTTHFDIGPSRNISNSTTWPGWWTSPPSPPFPRIFSLSTGAGTMVGNFVENKPYYAGMRALNATNLLNVTTATPISTNTFAGQTPFRLDSTPPQIQQVEISGEQSLGTTWITNLLDAEWTVVDFVGGVPPYAGSGANKYRFRIRVHPMAAPLPVIFQDWTLVDTLELRSFPLPTNTSANGQTVYLDIQARDRAGNWTPGIATSIARSDFTSPQALAAPRITNQVGNVISVIDTFSAAWDLVPVNYPIPGPGVLKDFESGIASYEWGISTTAIYVGFPDVFGYQPVQGFVTSGTVSQNNLLVSGDRVHAVLRARNFAGSVSPHIASTASLVDASLFTSLVGFPSAGLSPLSVQFTATVTGGQAPYTYTFQFDGTGNPARTYSISDTATIKTTTFVYDLSTMTNLPRPEVISRLIIRDAEGRESRKDFIVELLEDVLAGVSMRNHPAVQFFKYDGTPPVPLYSVQASASGGLLGMGVDPRGQYMAMVARDTDLVFRVTLDDVPNGQAGLLSQAVITGFGAGVDYPDSATFTFTKNLNKGMLVETFAGRPVPGTGCSTGSIRVVPLGVGFAGAPKEFPCLDAAQRDIRAAAASSLQLRVGAALQFEGSQTVARHISDLDTGFPRFDSFVLPAQLPSSIRVGTGDDAVGHFYSPPPPKSASNGSGFGMRAVARGGTSEIWYSSNEQVVPNADRGLHRVTLGSGGIVGYGKLGFATAVPAELMGPFDFNEDGSLILMSGGNSDGSAWKLSVARMPMASIPAFAVPGVNRLINLDLDDGGTFAVMATDTNLAKLAQLNLSANPPVIEPAGSWDNLDVSNAVFPGAISSEARLFRRPNKGYPKPVGLYSAGDCDLNGTPPPTAGQAAIVAGINLDKGGITVKLNKTGDALLETASPAAGNIPPFVTPDIANCPMVSNHWPTAGDRFHFKRVTLPPLTNGTAATLNACQLRLEFSVGSGVVSAITSASVFKP